MKKQTVLVLIILIAIISVSGCISTSDNNAEAKGSGNVINKNVNIHDISSVTLNGIGNLTIKQGNNEGLIITGEDNVLSAIKTDVKNDELKIDCPEGMPNPTKELSYELTVKDLHEVSMYGSSSINVEKLKTDKFELNLFGANFVNLTNVKLNRLISNGYGSFKLNANGLAKEHLITINGVGEYLSENLTTDDTEVTINGCGYTTLSASKELNANINGYGGIYYTTNTSNVKQNIFGSGEITTLDKADSEIMSFIDSMLDEKLVDIVK